MNALLDPFKALWKRKLWPVAVLLVAALVAVPMVLAKEPIPAPAPAANQAKTDDGLPATFVAAAETAEDGQRRRVLGDPKDPFAPAQLSAKAKAERKKAEAKEKAAEEKSKSETAKSESDSDDKTSSGGTADGGTSVPPVSAAPTPTATYPKFSIKVRFSATDAEEAPVAKTVERLAVLPNADAPVLVYRGVEDGGKVAVFELTGSVTAVGDGKCEPNPEDCQVLKLRAGETEFITVTDTGTETDAQYQLELLKINQKTTTEKAEAEALTKSKGAKLLSKLDRKPRYVFDPETGTLHKVRKK